MTMIRMAWRNIGRNRRRTILSATAIAIATATIVILFSLLAGMKTDLSTNLIDFYTGEIRVRNSEYAKYDYLMPLHLSLPADTALLGELDALPEVSTAAPRLAVAGAVFRGERRIGIQAIGVDFDRERAYSSVQDYIVAGDVEELISWEAPEATDAGTTRAAGPVIVPVLVGSRLLDRLGIEFGDQFTLVARTALRGTNAMTFRAVAVADFPVAALNEIAFWAPLERIQRLAQMPGRTIEILIKTAPGTDAEEAVTAVAGTLRDAGIGDPPPEVVHWTGIDTSYRFILLAETVYNFVALFFFLLASTVIINTTMMVIFERTREIGTLAAMGMRPGAVIRLFFGESVIVGVIGAAAGTLLGLGVTLLLMKTGINFGDAMEGVDWEMSTILYPVINLKSSIGVFLYSIAVSAITSFLPTRRITRMEPVAALRDE